jgi:hypothetical protein
MRAIISRLSLLLAVALAASAVMAASAQAQAVWIPDDAAVGGVSPNTTLQFGAATVACDTSTVDGTTGNDSPILDLELALFDNCNVSGLATTATCSTMHGNGDGGLRLVALDPVNDTGTVGLNPGFFCDFTVPGVCTVSVDGPQPDVGVFLLDEAARILTIEFDAAATRTGSSLCGPPSGTAHFAGDYDMWPGLEIVPAR